MTPRMPWPAFDRKNLPAVADYLAIALAASLPWSTSATGILVLAWLAALLPTLTLAALRRELTTPAGGLPLLLVAFAALGTLWAEVAWSARLEGFVSYLKLLAIPLLFVQFRRSQRGMMAIYALIAASTILLVASYSVIVFPGLSPIAKDGGVVVKDYISQSGFFTLSALLLVEAAAIAWKDRRRRAIAFALLAAAFLANIVYVSTSRTSLIVIPVLFALFVLRRSHWKTVLAACAIAAVVGAAAWTSSPYLRYRVVEIFSLSPAAPGVKDDVTSNQFRLAFWTASLDIVARAPLIGHGTGSIRTELQRYAADRKNALLETATNPHNQTFAVGIQLGLLGVLALYAMWLSHILLFRGWGLAVWFGLAVVVQNFVSSLANSHLFDFTQGWTYVVGVGIAGGAVLKQRLGSDARKAP